MAKGEDLRKVGQSVAARRGQLGMTQQQLADAAGVDLKTVYNLESGTRWPIAKTRAAIAAALGWEADVLAAIAGGEVPPAAGHEAPPRRPRRLKALEVSDPADLEPFLQDVRREVYTAAGIIGMFPPGDLPAPEALPELEPLLDALPGDVAFPDSPTEAVTWETRDRLSVRERVTLIARMRHLSARHAGGQRARRVSGLTASCGLF